MKKSKLIALLAICAMSATIAAGCSNPFASNKDSSSNSSVESSSSLGDESSSSATDKESSSSAKTDESSSTNGGNNSDSGSSGSDGSDSSSSSGGDITVKTTDIATIRTSAAGEYTAKGTVVAVNAQGFLLQDETGIILVYEGNAWTCDVAVGDVCTVKGTTSVYANAMQFGKGATYTKDSTATVTYPTAKVLTAADCDAYKSNASIAPEYVTVTGTLNVKENTKYAGSYYYNLAIDGAEIKGSITYPTSAQHETLFALNDKEVTVTGYVTGYKGFLNLLMTDVKEVEDDEKPEDTTLSFDTENASKEIKLHLTAGTYGIYTLDNELNPLSTVEFALSADGEKYDRFTFSVAEDSDVTLYVSWHAYNNETSCTCKYYLYNLTDPQITENTGSAELVAGVFTPVTITMLTKGTYMLTTTNSLTWSANMNGSTYSWDDTTGSTYTFTTTADNEAFTVYVKYDDLGNEYFTFDWTITVVPEYTLTVGETEKTFYKDVRSPIHFTATEEGYYTLTATKKDLSEDEDNPFYVSSLQTVYSFYAAAGDTVELYVVYHYGEATETATLTLSKMALADASDLKLGENKLVATTEGTSVTFKAPKDGWYAISDGWNGFLFFEDTEADEYGMGDYNKVVQLAEGASVTFTLKYIDFNYTGNTSELVTVTIEETEEPAPEIKLTVGENTITVYGEDVGAEVVLDSTFVYMTQYTFTWTDENLVVLLNFAEIESGYTSTIGYFTTLSLYSKNGETLENVTLTIDGDKATTGGDEDDGTFQKVELNKADTVLTVNYDSACRFSFTATETGSYTLTTSSSVSIAPLIYKANDYESDELVINSANGGSYTFTLEAGKTIYFEAGDYNWGALDCTVTITKDGGSVTPDPTPEPTIPELTEIALDAATTITNTENYMQSFKFTATEDGSYTLKTSAEIALFFAKAEKHQGEYYWVADYDYDYGDNENLLENGEYTFTLEAGATVKFYAKMTSADTFEAAITISKADTRTADQKVVDAAYELKSGEYLEGVYTLTGTITSIDTAYSSSYGDITVTIAIEGREDKKIQCFRLKGDGAADLAVGNEITVTGSLTNYYNKIEFDSGCILGDDKATYAETRVSTVINNLSVAASFTEAKTYPLTASNDVDIVWTLIDGASVATLDGNTLTIALPESGSVTVKVKASGTLEGKTAEKEFSITVTKPDVTAIASIDMTDTTNRTNYTTTQVTYSANGITFVNDKANSSNNCYEVSNGNAIRVYKNSTITISCDTVFTKVVLTLDDSSNGNYLKGFDGMTIEGATITRENDLVSITFTSATTTFTTANLLAQVRIENIALF